MLSMLLTIVPNWEQMVAYVLTIVLFTAVAWCSYLVIRMLRRRRAGFRWWVALAIASLFGAILGIWCGLEFEYRPSQTVRVLGFPMPIAVFHLEGGGADEQWIDFVSPFPVVNAIGNAFFILFLSAIPVGLAFLLSNRSPSEN
jgi:hypothetical protein